MADNNTHINYSKEDIEKYLQGKMTPSEMHAIEKAALQDPFLADAIEGYELADTNKTNAALTSTQTLIEASARNISITKPYSLFEIEQYILGNLSNNERHSIEKSALKDPFLADAIEGYEITNISIAKQSLQNISSSIKGKENEDAKVVTMVSANSKKTWLRIAAAILLMVGAGSTLLFINKKDSTNKNSIAAIQHAEIKNAPTNSIANPENSTSTLTAPSSIVKTEKVTPTFPALPKQNLESATSSNTAIASLDNTNVVKDEAISSDNKNLAGKIAGVKIEDAKDNAKKEQVYNATAKREVVASTIPSIENKQTDASTAFVNNNSNKNAVYGNNALNVVKGKVLNTNGEAVIANVNVKVNNQNYNVLTDKSGFFSIQVPDTNAIASIQSLGYEKQQLNLSANRTNNIVLNNDQQSLSEVVVTCYATSKKRSVTAASSKVNAGEIVTVSAIPIGGWDSFKQYVQQKKTELNNIDSTEVDNDISDVIVEFKIDNSGNPYNIKTPSSNNKKLIEIIKKGPKWATDKRNTKIKVVIQF
jgi:hypothetical protein